VSLSHRALRVLWALFAAGVLAGCAGAPKQDPLEPWNRKVFAFNEAVDDAVLAPTARAYRSIVPQPVRTGLSNFFSNVGDAWSAVNLVLQGRVADGLSDMMRFGTNTVLGLGGFLDIASEMGLERHGEDFGQTLGKWGVPPGPYIVWPVLGSSTLRDSAALPLDLQATPETFISPPRVRNQLTVTRVIDTRANLLQASRLLDEIALDKYGFVREAYLQRRRSLVYDGEPPEEDDEDLGPSPASPPAPPSAPAASAPAASAPAAAASAVPAPAATLPPKPAEPAASSPTPSSGAPATPPAR
jgi:phospholipid-binding lipoprotein MlaA